jgi:hypothetical protein
VAHTQQRATVTVGAGEHLPDPPSWDCLRCGRAWPCDPAREELAQGLRRTELSIRMWTYLEAAAGDMPTTPVREMFERFIAWTRQPPLP